MSSQETHVFLLMALGKVHVRVMQSDLIFFRFLRIFRALFCVIFRITL
jgi:hypothetical protein